MIPLPCPKCGSIPAVYRKKGAAGPSNFYRERVACKCGMATREHKAPGKAIATWNRRSSSLLSPDVAGMVKRLRGRAEGYREGGPSSEHSAALLDEAATALLSERTAHEQAIQRYERAVNGRKEYRIAYLKTRAENARLRKELHDAADALVEALGDVEHWASYAGEYFQNKHNLMGDLDRIREHTNIARSGGKSDD